MNIFRVVVASGCFLYAVLNWLGVMSPPNQFITGLLWLTLGFAVIRDVIFRKGG